MAFSKQECSDTQKGAVLVEFAIVLPLLLLLVVGIVEFSFTFYHLNILNKSVQDAARYFSAPLIARNGNAGSLIDTSSQNITNIDDAENLIVYGNIPGTTPKLMPGSFTPDPEFYCAEENKKGVLCLSTTQHITVTATYNHDFILGELLNSLTRGAISSSYPLKASATMRVP